MQESSPPRRVVIMGAAGRDFHNFNTVFRDNPSFVVVAFTAEQIPDIADRRYPPSLAGHLYREGIPIVPQSQLTHLITSERVDEVHLAYSDLSHVAVMHIASQVLAAGADFSLLGPRSTMIEATVPVIAVCGVRTGVGKSAISRHIARWFMERGIRIGIVRHPMPYGDLERQELQHFSTYTELDDAGVTIEEREEFEPYIEMGLSVFAGVDYSKVLERASQDTSVLLWDGGNNDLPFFKPNLHIVVLDPHRPGHELAYHPGEANFRMADALVINKVETAIPGNVEAMLEGIRTHRPGIPVILGDLDISVSEPALIDGARVVIVGDGPTLTHGEMRSGAGVIAAERNGAAKIVSARPHAVGYLKQVFEKYEHLDIEIPAMGYSQAQLDDLVETLRNTPADVILDATPVDLSRLMKFDRPVVNVDYEFGEHGDRLEQLLHQLCEQVAEN